MSSSGAGGLPRCLVLDDFEVAFVAPLESNEVVLSFLVETAKRDKLVKLRGLLVLCKFVDGKTSFFCLDAGKISSKSTGTPRETRKRRRMRDRIQSGGERGGGAINWFQREAERSVRKVVPGTEAGVIV